MAWRQGKPTDPAKTERQADEICLASLTLFSKRRQPEDPTTKKLCLLPLFLNVVNMVLGDSSSSMMRNDNLDVNVVVLGESSSSMRMSNDSLDNDLVSRRYQHQQLRK